MEAVGVAVIDAGLRAHWAAWTGAAAGELAVLGTDGPPQLIVVGSPDRSAPGWDGEVHPVTGLVDPAGNAVVSLPVDQVGWARGLVRGGADLDALQAALPDRLGRSASVAYRAVYRWAHDVPTAAVLTDVGGWLPSTDPVVPDWLRPFGGEVLLVRDDGPDGLAEEPGGRYLAGVGLKRHDAHVHEISVVTSEAARGRGLARRLVAQAARTLLARGVVPTYLHDAANTASARVADAAGFPDHGWGALGIFEPPPR